jgi:hypothetical protein
MKLELRRQPGDTTYCVPTALALITGETVGQITEDLREFLGDAPIGGVYFPLALAVFKKHGWLYHEVPQPRRQGLYFCCNKTHAFVMADGVYYDNSFPDGSSVSTLPKLGPHGICFELTKEP